MLGTLYELFWKDEYWIPFGYKWADLEDSNGITYPHARDMLAAIPLTFVLLIVRYIVERFIGLPLSRVLGIRDPYRMKVTPKPILESFFQTQRKNPEKHELNCLASQCGLSVRQTERWFRHRRNQDRPLKSKKFSEACWRFLFYSCTFFGGFLVICNETWFSQPETVWDGYPKQPLKPAIYWWYLLEISFYLSLMLTLTLDVKRKDFFGQIIHHFITIILIYFSYSANFVNIGALVLVLHDVSDIFLEAYKMLSYAQWKRAQEATFILFSLMFLITRLILFPIKVIYTTYYIAQIKNQFFFAYYFFTAILMVLVGLNAFWSFLILKMFYKFLSEGQVKNDVRSDVEEEDMSDEQLMKKYQGYDRV